MAFRFRFKIICRASGDKPRICLLQTFSVFGDRMGKALVKHGANSLWLSSLHMEWSIAPDVVANLKHDSDFPIL